MRPLTLTASNFKAILCTDTLRTELKDLNLLKKHTKNQKACSILKVFFALSKRPYFHRTYLVTARKRMSMAVFPDIDLGISLNQYLKRIGI